MPILQRICHLHSCWFNVINAVFKSTTEKYHLFHHPVDNEGSLESYFPCCTIQRMSPYMTNALAEFKNNTIHCSFCSDSLLDFIGRLAKKYSYICLCARYDSEDCFIDECVEVVCCTYIFRVMEHDENKLQLTKESFINILNSCKIAARKKHKKRLCNKKHLRNWFVCK
jgi:hypothetical protein